MLRQVHRAMPVRQYIHLSWTTYRRLPMIGPSEAHFLRRFLPAEAQRHGARVIAVGIVRDHLHLILRPPSAFDIPRLVQGLKGASARQANQNDLISRTGLRWAKGYDARSVSPQLLRTAIRYITGQAVRHPDRLIPGLKPGLG